MKTIAVAVPAILLAACAGVTITPISASKANLAHTTPGEVKGYVVYHPMVVVQLGETEVCEKRDSAGKCIDQHLICSMSAPVVLPDYSKPYEVAIQSGFGKAGAEIQIADGWRLSGLKDASDNTAFLSFLEKAAGFKTSMNKTNRDACSPLKPGLYRWTPDKEKVLTPLYP